MTDTKQKILLESTKLFALHGVEGFSMRTVAKEVGIAQSVLYHHFENKDQLLQEMFDYQGRELGIKRAQLPSLSSPDELLKQRIGFQLDNAEAITAVLKYFFAYRSEFLRIETGFVPESAYKHVIEVLELGKQTGEFEVKDLKKDAQVVTHAINGFVLEYFPAKLSSSEKEELIDQISDFILRALKK